MARHDRWITNRGVAARSPIAYEHEMTSRCLQYGAVFDHLNLKGLAMVEFLMHRLQLLEDVIAENPSALSFEGAAHYLGSDERAGGALMAPSLRAYVSGELARESAIQKERRKAREVRADGHFGGGRRRGRGGSGRGAGKSADADAA